MNVSAESELPNSNVNIANDSGKSVNINDVVFVDFESEPDASLVSSQSIAVDPDDAGNRVMKFENSTGKMNNVIKGITPKKLLYKAPVDKNGVLTYEFDLKFPTNNPMEDNEKGWYYPVATVFPTYEGTKTAYLRTCNVISASQNQNDGVLIDNYGEWYTVQEVFDYSSMTYSVFAQGKLVCSDISFAEEGVVGNDPMDGLVFRAYVPDGFEWYLDNLKISYTEDREYAPVSAFFQENFDDGEYDNTILKLPISAEVVDASIDDVIPEERGRVIKSDSSAGGTDSYFDVQNWKLQMERKVYLHMNSTYMQQMY